MAVQSEVGKPRVPLGTKAIYGSGTIAFGVKDQGFATEIEDDFAPHIETEIKRRLDAHMERLLAQHQN